MPAAGELASASVRPCGTAYALLSSATRWLGGLNAIGALAEVGFSLGVLGADVAPPDLSMPLAMFLSGVLACGLALLCWAGAQLACCGGRTRQGIRMAAGVGGLFYVMGLLAFAAGCWWSAALGLDMGGDSMGAVFAASATVL